MMSRTGNPLLARQRLAVQRVGEHRLRLHRVLERDAARELLLELERLLPEHDVLLSAVGAEEDDFAGFRSPTPHCFSTSRSGTPVKRPQDDRPCNERGLLPEHS